MKFKRIIILKGDSETGKTTKVNEIVQKLPSNTGYGFENTVGLNSDNSLLSKPKSTQ